MAKKPSMPDFTFALGADLREAAAKMRKMSQPPKHQSAQQSDDEPTDVLSDDIQEALVEDSTLEPSVTVEPALAPTNLDVTSASNAPEIDSPHCEESSGTIEPEENTSSVDSIEPVIDAAQPLGEPKPSETAEQEASAIKTEDTPDSSRGLTPKSLEKSSIEIPQETSTLLTAEEVEPEASQSISFEILSEAQAAPEVNLTGHHPSHTQEQPSEAFVGSPQINIYAIDNSDPTIEQSKTVDDNYSQVITALNSFQNTSTDANRHQQAHDNHNITSTANDTSPLGCAHSEVTFPSSPEIGKLTNVSNHSMYSPLAYGQSQTITDYQIYSTANTVPLHNYEKISTLPQNPFKPNTVEPKTPTLEKVSAQNDSHKLSRTVIAPSEDKQPIASKPVAQSNIPQGISPSIIAATLQDAHLGGARQVLLDALTALRQQSPQVVVNLKRLAPAIGLSYGTVRNTISRLVREGVICTTQVRTGDAHGVCVEFIDDNPLPSMAATARTRQPMAYQHQPPTVTKSHETPPLVPVSDTCIWDTDADLIAILWPFAADAGFGPAHLAQLKRAYLLQGWESENVSRCLRYLDWELSNGVSAGYEHVSTWLRIMQRQGHYPRPEGYVEPEILRLRQQAEEERELAEARTRFK